MRHGFCPPIISDQGREFCNQITDCLFKQTRTELRVTSSYHPQSNGLVERFNQTLVDALVKKAINNQNEWDRYVDSVLFACRTTKQKSTKMTPFFIMHLREANQLTHQPDDEEELQQKTIKTKMEDLVDKNIKVSVTSLQSYSSVPLIRKQLDRVVIFLSTCNILTKCSSHGILKGMEILTIKIK